MDQDSKETGSIAKAHAAVERARADALFTSIGEAVIAMDEYGKIMKVNEVALELLGYDENELIDRSFMNTVQMYDIRGGLMDPLDRPVMRALMEGKPVTDNVLCARKDGSRTPVAATASPIMIGNRPTGVIVVFRDITREQQIDRAKTEFVSLASHQLRTPLTATRWYVDLLLKGTMGPLTKFQESSLQEVLSSNLRMIELVDSLLSVARIEIGTLAFAPEPSNIKELARDVVVELKPQIVEKKLQFSESYDASIPPIPLDPRLTRIIFQNLLTNAVKYTPNGGKIYLKVERDRRYIHIQVKDTGYGIPKNQHKQLFTKLFRADNVRQQDTTGTGLGLYIVQSIVKGSKGKIWFESEENKGTTFHVCLPLRGMLATAEN